MNMSIQIGADLDVINLANWSNRNLDLTLVMSEPSQVNYFQICHLNCIYSLLFPYIYTIIPVGKLLWVISNLIPNALSINPCVHNNLSKQLIRANQKKKLDVYLVNFSKYTNILPAKMTQIGSKTRDMKYCSIISMSLYWKTQNFPEPLDRLLWIISTIIPKGSS